MSSFVNYLEFKQMFENVFLQMFLGHTVSLLLWEQSHLLIYQPANLSLGS